MKPWHAVVAVLGISVLILGWGAMRASSSKSEYVATSVVTHRLPTAREVLELRRAANYTAPDSRPTNRRVVPRALHLGRPRVKPAQIAAEPVDDLCLDVPPSIDECAGRYTAESMGSCIDYRVSLDDYQATYC